MAATDGPERAPASARRPLRVELPEREPKVERPFTTLAVVVGFLIAGLFLWAWLIDGKAVGVSLVEIPLLLLLTTPLFLRAARDEPRFDLAGILALGLVLRFAASYYRFLHAADAFVYHENGIKLAADYRHFNFGVDPGSPVPGTGGMRIVAGVVEVFTNGNMFGTFLVFTWLGFIGCYLFYRAFVTALPDCDAKRYALLVMLWPTMLYWPSSIGKDSWMLLTIALASLGTARLLTRARGGYVCIFLGLVGSALVRPHVTLLVFVAIGVAFIIGRRDTHRIPGQVRLGGFTKVVGIVVLLVAGRLLAPATARFLKLDDLTGDSVSNAIEATQLQTGEGGSAFTPSDPNSPIGYPIAVVTVLFRPLPGEVPGASGLLSGAEGGLLLVIAALSWRRIWGAATRLRRQPYVTYAAAYLAMFAYAFAAIANFGILARERVQVLPMFFVLLAVPPARRRSADAQAALAADQTPDTRTPAR